MSVFSQTLLLPIITASRKELTVQSRCPDTVGVRRFTGQKLLRSEQRYGTIHCSDDVYLLITRLQTIVCKSWKKEMGTSVYTLFQPSCGRSFLLRLPRSVLHSQFQEVALKNTSSGYTQAETISAPTHARSESNTRQKDCNLSTFRKPLESAFLSARKWDLTSRACDGRRGGTADKGQRLVRRRYRYSGSTLPIGRRTERRVVGDADEGKVTW